MRSSFGERIFYLSENGDGSYIVTAVHFVIAVGRRPPGFLLEIQTERRIYR